MRYRKKSIMKHKKEKLRIKKDIKRLERMEHISDVFAGVASDVISNNKKLYKIAMHNKYVAEVNKVRLKELSEQYDILAGKYIALEGLYIQLGGTNHLHVNKKHVADIIKKIQNNELVLKLENSDEFYDIDIVENSVQNDQNMV